MTAYNIVRFRVKPGKEKEFEESFRRGAREMEGVRKFALVKTGDRTYCSIGEWERMDDIVHARSTMIANLDNFRALLDDLGQGLGVTDPVSGEAVVEMAAKRERKVA